MSDSLCAWQSQYLRLIGAGITPVDAMRQCGVALETFSRERLNNAAFKAALDLAEAGIGSTKLDAAQLMSLREAGAGDDRCAAYFGMRVDEFWDAVKSDPSLQRVYETGDKRGEAMILLAQHTSAVSGDPTMLKFKGEQRLGQQTETEKKMTSREISELIAERKSLLEQMRMALPKPVIIDGEATEVEDANGT